MSDKREKAFTAAQDFRIPEELAEVINAGVRAGREVPGSVALGGTVCALFAHHRLSADIDFVLTDLNERFQEIRQQGKSYSNELLVFCVLPNALPYSRFGFSINSRLGGAVVRNRLKRRLREAIRLRLTMIEVGWDVVVIARRPLLCADSQQMAVACARLLRRAHLLREE